MTQSEHPSSEIVAAERLEKQLAFLREVDRLKSVQRQNILVDGSRRENSAEHSWHVALFALCLCEHGAAGIDRFKLVQLLLLHDIVEVDAGDVFLHEADALAAHARKEAAAAERIFGLLPADQRDAFLALWHEFEARESPESVLAHALDRVQPALLHEATGGVIWERYGTTHAQIQAKVDVVRDAAPRLWRWVQTVIARALAAGRLRAG